jgi:hypothetical protein
VTENKRGRHRETLSARARIVATKEDVVLQRIKVRITKLNFFPHFLKPCLVIIDWLLLIDMSPTHILHRPDGAAVQGIGVVLGMVFILALSMFLPSLYIRG